MSIEIAAGSDNPENDIVGFAHFHESWFFVHCAFLLDLN
jgi:hypothetical protein